MWGVCGSVVKLQRGPALAHDVLYALIRKGVLPGQLVIADAVHQVGQDDLPVPGTMDVIPDHDGYAFV